MRSYPLGDAGGMNVPPVAPARLDIPGESSSQLLAGISRDSVRCYFWRRAGGLALDSDEPDEAGHGRDEHDEEVQPQAMAPLSVA